MSTVADVLPYMQNWLDARTAQTAAVATFTTAKTAMATARQAVSVRVVAGDTAAAMSALVTTYVNARVTYLAQDALQRAAVDLTASRYATFEQMVELLATGQDVPAFGG